MKKFVAHQAEVIVCEDAEEMGVECAKEFERIINDAIAQRGVCTVALSGGSTPSLLYKNLVAPRFADKVDWTKVHFFVSDERCVELSSKNSNYGNAQRQFLDLVKLPAENSHPPANPGGESNQSAEQYEQYIKHFFKVNDGEFPEFDLLLLGMGTDGHCASLFPGTAALDEKKRVVISNEAVGTDVVNRLTFTFPAINAARNIVFLVQGGGAKSHILKEVLTGDELKYPVQRVKPVNGHLEWILDKEAAADFMAVGVAK